MNKVEIEAQVAEQLGIKKSEVERVVGAFLGCIEDTLKRGESVQLVRFATFQPVRRKARMGKNPLDGSDLEIPESVRVKFKPGKNLKDIPIK
jgi:DNA-binding protein HU-beta